MFVLERNCDNAFSFPAVSILTLSILDVVARQIPMDPARPRHIVHAPAFFRPDHERRSIEIGIDLRSLDDWRMRPSFEGLPLVPADRQAAKQVHANRRTGIPAYVIQPYIITVPDRTGRRNPVVVEATERSWAQSR